MKKILCFGDSNTYGYRYTDRGRFDENTRWTALLAKKLFPYGFEVIESGLNGCTTVFDDKEEDGKNGSKILPTVLKENDPLDYAIIMLGTNDCKTQFHASADMIADGVEIIISQIKCFDSNIKILLACPAYIDNAVLTHNFSRSFDEDSIPKSAALEKKLQYLAMQNDCLFLSAARFVKTNHTDGIHLDENSHAVLAEAFFQCLKGDFA